MTVKHNNTRQRWEQAQILHDILSSCKKRGSMENVLSHHIGDHISKIDFCTGVKIEFGSSDHEEIEKLYDTFSTRNDQQSSTSSRLPKASHILWTYLSITYRRVIMENPRKVILMFCAIATSTSTPRDKIYISDLRDILNLGSLREDETSIATLDRWVELYFENINDTRVQHCDMAELEKFIDLIPGLVLRFRDNIRVLLNEKNRLSLLARKEAISTSCFQNCTEKLLLQRTSRRWRSLLHKCFLGWNLYTRKISTIQIQNLQILYWKAHRMLHLWQLRLKSKRHYCDAKVIASSHCPQRKKRRYFSTWHQISLLQRTFRFETQSRMQVALGISIVRGTMSRLKARKVMKMWHQEATVQLRIDHARQWRSKFCKDRCFGAWLNFIDLIKGEVAQNDHRRSVADRMKRLCTTEKDKEYSNRGILKTRCHEEFIGGGLSEAINRRNRYDSSVDKAVLDIQTQERRARFRREKEILYREWTRRWDIEEEQRIRCTKKKVEAWLKTWEGRNKSMKYTKNLQRELTFPASTSSTSCTVIALCILDSLIGHRGVLSDVFFYELDAISTEGILSRDRFEQYLKDIAVPLSLVQCRDIFEGVEPLMNDCMISITALKKAICNTYIYHGQESSRWKKYIDPAHNSCVFHNVIEGSKLMDFRLDKRALNAIARDYFLSRDTVQERRKIREERKNDFEITNQIWAVSVIQCSWRSRKRVRKTRRRILLKKRKGSVC